MKYTREQRLDIAQKIYGKEMTIAEAAIKYDLNLSTVKGYLRLYRAENDLPPRNSGSSKNTVFRPISKVASDTEDLESMTKEELIREVIMARINEAPARLAINAVHPRTRGVDWCLGELDVDDRRFTPARAG